MYTRTFTEHLEILKQQAAMVLGRVIQIHKPAI